MEAKTTVTMHKSQGKYYFRTAIPQGMALKILGLKRDVAKQKLKWIYSDYNITVRRLKRSEC